MSDYVGAITSHAVASELDHSAIDLNHPDLNDPMEYQDSDSSSSDCESIISVDQSGLRLVPFISSGLVELSEGDMVRRFLEDRFLWRVGALREQVTVVAIHQNGYSSVSAKGRARAFQACSEAVEKKGNGNSANVRYAWYAASRKEVSEIFSHGFGYSGKPENSGLYGRGLYFAPENHLLESVKVAPMDEEGLRHVLLCRVILGKPELVSFGSEQSHPNSEQYDSGIDDLSYPTRYIVWSTHMNTHVLPEYVISFRAPCHLRVLLRTLEKSWKPTSPRVTLSSLVAKLSKILLPSDANLMSEYYKDYKGGKISRHVLIQKVKQMGGKFADWNHQKILEISKKEREVAGYGTMEGLD